MRRWDGVTVGNGGTIDVGTSSVATLLLDDGTVISNGNLATGYNGTLDIEKGATGPGATLDGVTVGNGGTIDVGATASGAVLDAGRRHRHQQRQADDRRQQHAGYRGRVRPRSAPARRT